MIKRLLESLPIIVIVVGLMLLGMGLFRDKLWPPVSEVRADLPSEGRLKLVLQPTGVVGRLQGGQLIQNQQTIPLTLTVGEYDLTLTAPGYTTQTQRVEIVSDSQTTVSGALRDETPPEIRLKVHPVIAPVGQPVTIMLKIDDAGSRGGAIWIYSGGDASKRSCFRESGSKPPL